MKSATLADNDVRRFPTAAALRVLTGAGILWFVISRADLGQLSLRWDTRASFGFAFTVAIIAIAQVLSTVRWKLILGKEAGASFGYLLRVNLVGIFFSLFLPTSVGGDAVRAVAISRTSPQPVWAVTTVFMERALGLIAMFLILAVGALLAPTVFTAALAATTLNWRPAPVLVIGAILVAAALAWLALRLARNHPRLQRAFDELKTLGANVRANPRGFGAALLVSFLVQLAYVVAWYQLAVALRLPPDLQEFLVFVPFVSIAAMLPVTIAGIGLREGTAALLLSPHGVAAADAIAYSLLYFAAFLIIGLVGAAVFAFGGLHGGGPSRFRPARSDLEPSSSPR